MEERAEKAGRSIAMRIVIVAAVLACLLMIYACSGEPTNTNGTTENVAIPAASTEPTPEFTVQQSDPSLDYSKFDHGSTAHTRMPCLLCHVRSDEYTTPKLSGHTPCAACHVQQFADSSSKMCTICHTDTSTGAVKRFPPLRSFNIKFDHGRHLSQTGCATCHTPTRRGVALSVPSGARAHSTCFTCHEPQTEVEGRNIGSCNTCHEPGRPIKGSESAKAFKFKFSHRTHTAKANCSTCHTVLAGAARGRQVTSPVTAMHFASGRGQSCASCHNGKRAFGADDFTNCKRCHEGNTFNF
jgi:c(7)-type cytochrome triheme protein